MLPELRAMADRLVFDVAMVRYVARRVPKGGLDREVAPGAWTVRQVIGHLAGSQGELNAFVGRFLAGEPLLPEGIDFEQANQEMAASHRRTALPKLLTMMAEARDATVALFSTLEAAQLDAPALPVPTLRAALDGWSRHFEEHCLDFADALPELRHDPMLLNWALHPDFSANAGLEERQRALAAEVRDRLDGEADEEEA